jgi:hypothetical protein
MDPYLEDHWRDVHHRLITYASDELQTRLPRDLRARVEERVVVEPADEEVRSVYPDVRIVEHSAATAVAVFNQETSTSARPIVVRVADEPATEGFIEIFEAGSGQRVVTVIEFLSLTNKLPGEGRDDYRRKQRELKAGRVSLVEIDLLRAGQRTLAIPTRRIPRAVRTTYQACVRRGWRTNEYDVYAIRLREPLPDILVPLRHEDQDVVLKLQELIDQAHRNGRYETTDYQIAPEPPLEPGDEAWADDLLRKAGLRKS